MRRPPQSLRRCLPLLLLTLFFSTLIPTLARADSGDDDPLGPTHFSGQLPPPETDGTAFIQWGGGGLNELTARLEVNGCHLNRLWVYDDRTQRYTAAYTFDGPGFLNSRFNRLYSDNIPPTTLWVKCKAPGQELTGLPLRGLVELKTGPNRVAWAGPSGWSVSDVAQGIGSSLVQMELAGHRYRPEQPVTAENWPLIQRGDALVVTVSRDVNWLQPTGDLPEIVFLGNPSPKLKDAVHEDLQSVMDFFAETFKSQVDPTLYTLVIPDTLDSLLEYEQSEGDWHPKREATLRTSWAVGGAWAGDITVVKEDAWECTHCHPRYTITHEYFHLLQQQVSDHGGRRPQWLVEGTASWASAMHAARDGRGTQHSQADWLADRAAKGPPLDSAVEINANWQYLLGEVASRMLAEASGIDSPLEFYRLALPTGVGPDNRWQSVSAWPDTFLDAFGHSVDEFYERFSAWQDSLPGRRVLPREPDERVLSGTLRRADLSPITNVWITATQVEDGVSVSFPRRIETDKQGDFEFFVPRDASYRLGIELGLTHPAMYGTQTAESHMLKLTLR